MSESRPARVFPTAQVTALADRILIELEAGSGRAPWLVGLSGLPGSGKSTMAQALARVYRQRGIDTLVLGLDDFYLGKRERRRLAREVHPLFLTRGPAGTHDSSRLAAILAAIQSPSRFRPLQLPRFDRLRD